MFASALLMVSLAAGAPYEDTRGRFRLELPSAWTLAPEFGDTEGMRFIRRAARGETGSRPELRIAVVEEETASVAAGAAQRAWRSEGWSVRRSTKAVAGHGAVKLEGRTRDRRRRLYVFDHGGFSYRLRLDCERGQTRRSLRDFERVVASFRPLAGSPRARPDDTTSRPSFEDPPVSSKPTRKGARLPKALIGDFESEAGTVLRITPQGRFQLGKVEGRIEVQGQQLELHAAGGRVTRFTFAVSDKGLALSSEALAQPAVYRRVRPGGRVLGRWILQTPRGPMTLRIEANGRFSLGDNEGQWVVEGDVLRLRRSPREVVSYRYRRTRDRLWLSGGDLDEEVSLQRAQ